MIYLIDDDPSVRQALHLLLQTYELPVTCFESPADCLAHLDRKQPGILITDLRMPLMSGLQMHEQLQAQGLDWPTIIITGHGDLHACRRAFKAGVTDFLTKPVEEQTLLEAIEAAQAKLRHLAERREAQCSLQSLTEREREVLELITKGLGSKEIATTLEISVRTVDTHRAKLAEKLGTGSVAEQTRLLLCASHP
ncbi:MAG: response regulator [Comamonas sp.]|jgi:FixJ family two-component response regulator|uniref:response regulator transcription factor n=1 Tax=Comamonas sp. TaxID=34028 RepID=UPI002833FC36|nr:response regulator [Comamonas sp.]MDR0215986.1 response regulator [Comamonas sp.]